MKILNGTFTMSDRMMECFPWNACFLMLSLLLAVFHHIYMEFVQSSRDSVTKAVTAQNALCFYKTQGWLPSRKILICHFSEMRIFLVFISGVHKGISTGFQTHQQQFYYRQKWVISNAHSCF